MALHFGEQVNIFEYKYLLNIFEIDCTLGTTSAIIIPLMCFSLKRCICLGYKLRTEGILLFPWKKKILTKKEDTHQKERYSPKVKYLFDILVKFLYPPLASIVTHVALINWPRLASPFSGEILEIEFPGYLALNNFQL